MSVVLIVLSLAALAFAVANAGAFLWLLRSARSEAARAPMPALYRGPLVLPLRRLSQRPADEVLDRAGTVVRLTPRVAQKSAVSRRGSFSPAGEQAKPESVVRLRG